MKDEKKIIVIGFGNEMKSDIGIGHRIVTDLAANVVFDDIHYKVAVLDSLEILEFIDGYTVAVFIDGIHTSKGIAGSVYLYTPQNFKPTLHLTHLHDISFSAAFEMGQRLGFKLPQVTKIIAIEIAQETVFTDSLTQQLSEAYPGIITTISNYLETISTYSVLENLRV